MSDSSSSKSRIQFDTAAIQTRLRSIAKGLSTYAQDLPSKLKRLPTIVRSLPGRLNATHQRLMNDQSLRFKTVCWSLVITFVSICILSNSNPFRLLIPGWAVALPAVEQRAYVRVYGISRDSGQPVAATRPVSLDGGMEERLQRVAFLVNQPMGLDEKQFDESYRSLDFLPDLGYAIKRIWFVENLAGGLVIVDLRKETVMQELDSFYRARQSTAEDSDEMQLADAYFISYTASIFSVEDKAQAVQYLLDGQSAALPGMRFDLSRRYLRTADISLATLRN